MVVGELGRLHRPGESLGVIVDQPDELVDDIAMGAHRIILDLVRGAPGADVDENALPLLPGRRPLFHPLVDLGEVVGATFHGLAEAHPVRERLGLPNGTPDDLFHRSRHWPVIVADVVPLVIPVDGQALLKSVSARQYLPHGERTLYVERSALSSADGGRQIGERLRERQDSVHGTLHWLGRPLLLLQDNPLVKQGGLYRKHFDV